MRKWEMFSRDQMSQIKMALLNVPRVTLIRELEIEIQEEFIIRDSENIHEVGLELHIHGSKI